MNRIQELYNSKKRDAYEAIKLIKDGDWICLPLGIGEPPTVLTALSEQRRNYHDVKVMQMFAQRKYGYYDPETAENVRHVALFVGVASRKGAEEGWAEVIPNNFYSVPKLIRDDHIKVDVAASMVSPMDSFGYFSLGVGADYSVAAISKAREVIVEVSPEVPYVYGNNKVHISQVSAVIESQFPLFEIPIARTITPVEKAIGEYVAEFIKDGDTLQIGLGSIPDVVITQLQNRHDLGIHTEVMTDCILNLFNAGAITGRKKNYLPGKMICTLGQGTRKLFGMMDHNPMVEMHPVDFTNDPYLAGKNNNLVSINGSIQIDFLGQCNSETMGVNPFSGTGGQADFAQACARSEGGRSFITLPSTASKNTISRIVPTLSPGSAVTTTKNDVMYVVTEYGVAKLRGKSRKQRAQELISIAHPDFRAELTMEARKMNLL
ncbi:acetyl-CoA hydrolase/transferase family protein [Desulfosporosinus shakirovi]|uniref:acetyl-CoA hydrolase/transferase family protein n=1 Tax=Desulfosporosinus shakirovi TaxID=2885154 RepID=UPI001E38E7DB|nr:acetyl-CoA hydrolase/transferase C-terminal domain-containing protein [Desulfosporosinus sp. SRJS8]MCB8817111.1 4-hydroxybutyrate CoA-transferase [Desulfosporosinus sp. SRJS8]